MNKTPTHIPGKPARTERRTALSATLPPTLLALLLAGGLAACQPSPESTNQPTVGQQVDGAIARTESKAAEVKADVKEATAGMRAETSQAADTAGIAIKDAAITAAVNAKLAADPALSALRINVDTEGGRVALSGDAPDVVSRDRASVLARSVDGVVDVNNRLTIQGKG